MSTQRLVKTFCDLVSTGSETGHERAFCIELEKALIEAGFEVERDEEAGKKCGSDGFNIYGYLPGEGESVLLSCHTDTVTPGAAVTPVERDGVIYSDGTTILGSDDKSGIAEIIEAVTRLKENGEKTAFSIENFSDEFSSALVQAAANAFADSINDGDLNAADISNLFGGLR